MTSIFHTDKNAINRIESDLRDKEFKTLSIIRESDRLKNNFTSQLVNDADEMLVLSNINTNSFHKNHPFK